MYDLRLTMMLHSPDQVDDVQQSVLMTDGGDQGVWEGVRKFLQRQCSDFVYARTWDRP